jgi:hypothetical protein
MVKQIYSKAQATNTELYGMTARSSCCSVPGHDGRQRKSPDPHGSHERGIHLGEMLAMLGPSRRRAAASPRCYPSWAAARHAGTVLAGASCHGAACSALRLHDEGRHAEPTPHNGGEARLLRLPRAMPAAAEAVITELALAACACADTIVSNAFVHGVSRGERKHVIIRHQMLPDPAHPRKALAVSFLAGRRRCPRRCRLLRLAHGIGQWMGVLPQYRCKGGRRGRIHSTDPG